MNDMEKETRVVKSTAHDNLCGFPLSVSLHHLGRMRQISILLFAIIFCSFAKGDNIWITKSLRAYLIIQLITNPEANGPSFRVLLALQNVGVEGSAGNIPTEVMMSYSEGDLALRVTDQNGKELHKSVRDADEMVPDWNLSIPPDGLLTFPIGRGGEQPYPFSSEGKGKLLSCGLRNEWIIPSGDGSTYYLSGVFNGLPKKGDRPLDWNHPVQWSGAIDLAKVEIPKN
jgi:hypothetical protein